MAVRVAFAAPPKLKGLGACKAQGVFVKKYKNVSGTLQLLKIQAKNSVMLT